MTRSQTHSGPEPWEQQLIELWDTITAARLRSGVREANTLAKRALSAVGDEMFINTSNAIAKAADPKAVLAMLQQLRTGAENEGDMDAADQYSEAIRSLLAAGDTSTVTDDASDAPPAPIDPNNAQDIARAVRLGKEKAEDMIKKLYRGVK